MAYPWSANDILTAADLNAAIGTGIVSTGLGAWTSFTPTLTQSATPTKTSTATYAKVGRIVTFSMTLNLTSSGTASNNIVVGLPLPAVGTGIQGYGSLFDASASLRYHFIAFLNTSTTVILAPTSATSNSFLGSGVFTAALASGDIIQMNGMYESTT